MMQLIFMIDMVLVLVIMSIMSINCIIVQDRYFILMLYLQVIQFIDHLKRPNLSFKNLGDPIIMMRPQLAETRLEDGIYILQRIGRD